MNIYVLYSHTQGTKVAIHIKKMFDEKLSHL